MSAQGAVSDMPQSLAHNTPDLYPPQTPRKRRLSAPNPSPYRAPSVSPGRVLSVLPGDNGAVGTGIRDLSMAQNGESEEAEPVSIQLLASRRPSWIELTSRCNLEHIVRGILNCVDAGLMYALVSAHKGLEIVNIKKESVPPKRYSPDVDYGFEKMQDYLRPGYLEVLSKFQSYVLNKFFLYESSLERGHWLRRPEEEGLEFSEEAAEASDSLGVHNRVKTVVLQQLIIRRQELVLLEAELKAVSEELRDLEAKIDESSVPELLAKIAELESLNATYKRAVALLAESRNTGTSGSLV